MEEDDRAEELAHLKELLILMTKSSHNKYITLDDEVDQVSEGSIKQWFQELNEEIKVATTSLDYQVKGHRFIVPELFKLLHECLLSHRWEPAARILQALAYEPKGTSQTLWKAGMEVLYSSPTDNETYISQLVRQIKILRDVQAQDVVLEFLMYLMSRGKLNEAAVVVRQKDHKKSGFEKTVNVPAFPAAVYKAYKGLVWYVEWLVMKRNTKRSENTTVDEMRTSSQTDFQDSRVSHYARQAMGLMDGLVDEPGVWDTFVVKLVELKEEYEGPESARNVLRRYRDQNPDNPNAHRYLYQLQLKHGATDEEKIQVLQDLVSRDPSNCLVLDLYKLLKDSPSVGLLLFNMLDYSCWQTSVECWETFSKYLLSVQQRHLEENMKVVDDCWKIRATWWPAYHFTLHENEVDQSLLVPKALSAALLQGRDNDFTVRCITILDEEHRQNLTRELDTLDAT